MKTLNQIYFVALVLIVITSCKKDKPDDTNTTPTDPYKSGIFIVNEGQYGSGSGSISFFNRDSNQVDQDIFQTVNNAALGNVVQSMAIYNSKAYVVVNNASKVEVVKASTFETAGTIDGLVSPRYFVGINSAKGYVSDWGASGGNIAVVDLATNTVTSTIDVKGAGPENMLLVNEKLFVINSGGWGTDSTVAVIDTQNDSLLEVVTVGKNPRGIQLDANGNIWVLCAGYMDWMDPNNDTKGSLVKLNAATYAIEQSLEFSTAEFHPSELICNTDKTKFYYIFGSDVFEFDVTSSSLNSSALFFGNFYAIGYDPETDYIYAADPIDYVQSGLIYRYKTNGDVVDSFSAGVIPTDFWFE